ncbi:MAG TPA: hypothetical protein VFN25_05920 [Dokdonella sp.]|uniref:hypothetical protein n=1 Tax=Dokdonella sp. TaxID=2291710 RepID=UPI002D7F9E8F|nr:hypothetical protein [Dokdonella sp.]HET9032423.1 hypothetical protein [Dokdonella sp.]
MATLLAVGSLMAGCTTQATKSDHAAADASPVSDSAKKLVEKRAIERWDLLIAHKAEKAYDFLSPGYRATKKRDDYAAEMNHRPVQWEKVLPYSQTCDKPNVCVISLQVDSDVKMQGISQNVPVLGFVTETWIKTQGKWYYLPNAKHTTGSE